MRNLSITEIRTLDLNDQTATKQANVQISFYTTSVLCRLLWPLL